MMTSFVADYPPSTLGGGDLLFYRLFLEQPQERMSVFTSAARMERLSSGPYSGCAKGSFPEFGARRQHGLGRLSTLVDRVLLPVLAWRIWRFLRSQRAEVVVSVAHGYYFLAAAAAAKAAGIPFVLFVHDDWVKLSHIVYGFRHIAPNLFRWALKRAGLVYSISSSMQAYLSGEYGVESRVELPSTIPNPWRAQGEAQLNSASARPFRVVFSGAVYDTVHGSLDLLVEAVSRIPAKLDVRLEMYSQLSGEEYRQFGWDRDCVQCNPWVRPDQLQQLLVTADILFVPVSFGAGARHYSETSFPSKLADYLAAGRPVLVLGPEDSTVAKHVREHGCGVVVGSLSHLALAEVLAELSRHRECLAAMSGYAVRTFETFHNVERRRAVFFDELIALKQKGK